VRPIAAQALVRFLAQQYAERDSLEHKFFGGCFRIFGHGIVAGIGQAHYRICFRTTRREASKEWMSPGSSSTGSRFTVASAAPVTMFVVPGPIDVVHANVLSRFFCRA
jgi:TPP-dependent trihydroxycyclohexane-1,2-dione (THcHDO) dehydratase